MCRCSSGFFSWRHTFHTRKCKQDGGDLWTAVQLPLIHSPPLSSADFPGGSDGKESACNEGDPVLTTWWGRSPGEGNGNPLQYSYLGNPLDRGAWGATVHGVAKSQTWRRDFHFHFSSKLITTVGSNSILLLAYAMDVFSTDAVGCLPRSIRAPEVMTVI